ncbi:MAG: MIP/aquaporin family protein [Candidatus Bathyarchaeia archaeon]
MGSIPCAKCKKECTAEFLGTYLLVLFGAGSVIVSTFIKGFVSLVFVASIFGGTVALVILLLGKHSGAHINPAVTLAHAFARKARTDTILPYLCFQAVGGIVAAFTLRLFFLKQSVMPADLGSTELARGVTPLYGILLEAIGTFLLCSAALTATFYVRRPIRQAVLVGGTLFLLILLIGHLTGASFNPARTIGPALSSGHWSNILVYLIGPLVGALFAAIPFRLSQRETKLEFSLCSC